MRALLLLLALRGAVAFAQGPHTVPAPEAPPAPSNNPNTRPRAPVVKPTELLKCKVPGTKEEAKVREAAEAVNFSDHEVMGRLIFTETLATGFFAKKCNAAGAESLMEAIGWMIINRVDKYSPKRDDPKPDAIFHEVFARKGFASSFSSKNENPFAKAFLCPLEAQKYLGGVKSTEEGYTLYVQAKEVAARILDKYTRTGIDPRFSKIRNVFYPHSEIGGADRPSWAKDPDPTKNKGFVKLVEGEKPCAEFYKK